MNRSVKIFLSLLLTAGAFNCNAQSIDSDVRDGSEVVADTAAVTLDAGIYRPAPEQKYARETINKEVVWNVGTAEAVDEDVILEDDSYHGRWFIGHWAGVGLGYAGLISDLGNFSLPQGADYLKQRGWSTAIAINFFDYAIVKSRHILLLTGLGIEINNFRFDGDLTLARDGELNTVPEYFENGVSNTKLATSYLNVPLIIEFQFGRDNRVFINLGGVAGIKMNSHTKFKTSGEPVTKRRNNFNIRDFHYGFTASAGFDTFGISATYYPRSIFRDGRGPDVQQANIGLMVYF